ncbi:MAG: hypothetical protein EZS28_018346, partial [Streblomastix strix]
MVEEGISEGLIPFTFRRPIRGFEGLLNEDGDIDYLGEIANGGDQLLTLINSDSFYVSSTVRRSRMIFFYDSLDTRIIKSSYCQFLQLLHFGYSYQFIQLEEEFDELLNQLDEEAQERQGDAYVSRQGEFGALDDEDEGGIKDAAVIILYYKTLTVPLFILSPSESMLLSESVSVDKDLLATRLGG